MTADEENKSRRQAQIDTRQETNTGRNAGGAAVRWCEVSVWRGPTGFPRQVGLHMKAITMVRSTGQIGLRPQRP